VIATVSHGTDKDASMSPRLNPGRGATVWLTGLPSSGKSVVARGLRDRLSAAGTACYLLDGDQLRRGICSDLGFSAEARDENVRRAAEIARLFADAGMITVCALISPYERGRAQARFVHEVNGLGFVEVYVSTPLEVCEQRDTKGLYARARAGELKQMTGIDDPYEVPQAPDVEVSMEFTPVDAAIEQVLAAVDAATSSSPLPA
jgi:adenylyl-sulfate kinase